MLSRSSICQVEHAKQTVRASLSRPVHITTPRLPLTGAKTVEKGAVIAERGKVPGKGLNTLNTQGNVWNMRYATDFSEHVRGSAALHGKTSLNSSAPQASASAAAFSRLVCVTSLLSQVSAFPKRAALMRLGYFAKLWAFSAYCYKELRALRPLYRPILQILSTASELKESDSGLT